MAPHCSSCGRSADFTNLLFAHDHRCDDEDGAADGGADDQERDLEAGRRHAADEGQDAAPQRHGGSGEDAAAQPPRDAGFLETLREPAAGQHHAHAEDPGQDGEVAAHRLAVAQAVDQVGGEPGEAERQAPVAGEARQQVATMLGQVSRWR